MNNLATRSNLIFSTHMKTTFSGILSMILCLLLAGCQNSGPDTGRKGPAGGKAQAVSVHTTRVQKVSMTRQVTLSGTLVSPDQAKVSSEVAGLIKNVTIQLGQEVRQGQPLVYVDSRELEIALSRTESQLRQTEAQLGIDGEKIKEPLPTEQIASVRTAIANLNDARSQLARASRMFEQKLLPQSDLDTTKTNMEVAEAAYQSAIENVVNLKAALHDRRAAVQLAKKKLDDAVIKAPVSGAVSERLVQNGEYISERTPICTIVQMSPLKLKTAIQERYVSRIHPGQVVKFNVESFPGEEFEGKIAYISPAIDQDTRTFVVEALVENGHRRLKPGFFTKGTVNTHSDSNVLAISDSAISTLAGVSTVFIIEGNAIRQQAVTLGSREGGLVEITTGLQGNETLAASNLSQLATGVLVKTTGEITLKAAQDSSLEAGEQGGDGNSAKTGEMQR